MGRFDAIVIGSGLGGLTAAALYAAAGRRVLVLERNKSFGGAASVYNVGELRVEASLHELPGFGTGGSHRALFEELGLVERVRLVDVGDLYEVRSPLLGEPMIMPEGIDKAIEATSARFPTAAASVRNYFERIAAIRGAAMVPSSLASVGRLRRLLMAPSVPFRMRALLKSRRLSLAGVLDELFGDEEALKLALSAHLAYYTDRPDQLAFALWGVAQGSYHVGGGRYPYGGSKAVTDALLATIEENGGQAESRRRVTRILMSEGAVTGVQHEGQDSEGADRDTREERAPVLFGNAAPHALAEMLPDSATRTSFMSAYADRPVSISLWTLALGLERRPQDFGVERHSTCFFPDWMRTLDDMPRNASLLADSPAGRLPYRIFVNYTAVDTGLTPNPPFLATVSGVDRVENWEGLSSAESRKRSESWMDAIVEALDLDFPGLASAVTQRTMTTALSTKRYLNTPRGAIYGFAPHMPVPRRLVDPATPIKGLWLASAYTGVGGFFGSMGGGAAAARAALRRR